MKKFQLANNFHNFSQSQNRLKTLLEAFRQCKHCDSPVKSYCKQFFHHKNKKISVDNAHLKLFTLQEKRYYRY